MVFFEVTAMRQNALFLTFHRIFERVIKFAFWQLFKKCMYKWSTVSLLYFWNRFFSDVFWTQKTDTCRMVPDQGCMDGPGWHSIYSSEKRSVRGQQYAAGNCDSAASNHSSAMYAFFLMAVSMSACYFPKRIHNFIA